MTPSIVQMIGAIHAGDPDGLNLTTVVKLDFANDAQDRTVQSTASRLSTPSVDTLPFIIYISWGSYSTYQASWPKKKSPSSSPDICTSLKVISKFEYSFKIL